MIPYQSAGWPRDGLIDLRQRTLAEMRFAAIEKRQREVLTERVQAADKVRKKTAKLKALRLLKEADDILVKEP